ncbi:MAG: hypoxanthine phosphoribosyltransferase [candidate division WOR-3 bacterium]
MISDEEIAKRVSEIASEIERDYKDKNPVLVGVLNGAFIFIADLCRALNMDVEIDFIGVSSYGDSDRPGVLRLTKDLSVSIEGRDVIVVEDIVDTGRTLFRIIEYLKSKKPKSLSVCAFLDKAERREVPVKVDYVGFVVPNEFLVGYGLDYAGYGRHLPYVKSVDTKGG